MTNLKLQQLSKQFGLEIVPLNVNKDTRMSDPFDILYIYNVGINILTVNGTFTYKNEEEVISLPTEDLTFYTDTEGRSWVKKAGNAFAQLCIMGTWYQDENGQQGHQIRVLSHYLSGYFSKEGEVENYDAAFYCLKKAV
jgi:hypothetical protein